MDWFRPMDEYCERVDASFWSEPMNAISNAAFIVAAIMLFLQWRRVSGSGPYGPLLILNVFIIGVGSFLYHTFANRWSEIADVVPIAAFILFYLTLGLHSYLGLRWWQSLSAVAVFFALSQLFVMGLEPTIGYTATYLPALATIYLVGLAMVSRQRSIANGLLLAGLVFTASVMFRAADLPFCVWLPQGTHMVWHLLNATMLFLLVRLYLLQGSSAAPARH